MKVLDIAKAVNAAYEGPDSTLSSVSIDSRQMTLGALFIALRGKRYDGHYFIKEAINKGAKAVMAMRPPENAEEQGVPFLYVSDTVEALGRLGAWWREQFSYPLVGITGSCGKTTVKEMVAHICRQKGNPFATPGTRNNAIGLPLSLLQLSHQHHWGVIEMGTNAPGEIAYLSGLTKPTVGVVTNIGAAHLEGFGTLDQIAQEKGALYAALAEEGIAVINQEEPFATTWQEHIGERKQITFGFTKKADVSAEDVIFTSTGMQFRLRVFSDTMTIPLLVPGRHMVNNALAAAAVAAALEVPLTAVQEGLATFSGVGGRLTRKRGYQGALIIDDTYNANPASMRAALDVLRATSGEKIMVMGDMGELGEHASAYHAEIGLEAKKAGVSELWVVGPLSVHAAKAFGSQAFIHQDKESLIEALKPHLQAHSVVLVKGSRSSQMEEVSHALLSEE